MTGHPDHVPEGNLSPLPRAFVITTLAQYQTKFWRGVGTRLRAQGIRVLFLSYDDRSHEELVSAGLESVNAFDAATAAGRLSLEDTFSDWVERLGVPDPNLWLSHERVAFNLTDGRELRRKFCAGASAAESVLLRVKKEGYEPILVQELGGFISVVSAFFVARAQGVDSIFIEPSFFRGRLHFNRNTFRAWRPPSQTAEPRAEVRSYLEETRTHQSIVIPTKDKHHYAAPATKILNVRNLRRLGEKILDRWRGKRQEFGYLGHHVGSHLRMLSNSARLRGHYTQLSEAGRFIYFPLHVPGDVALTLRAPEYFDQLALIDYMARTVPFRYRVAFKEHPAMIGALDAGRIRALLSRHDNLFLLPPHTNNFAVLRAAEAVVTVNSKSGAEALLEGKPVFVLGDAFYRDAPGVRRIDRLTDLPAALRELGTRFSTPSDPKAVERFFQLLWDGTFPGDLYRRTDQSTDEFAQSLLAFARRGEAPAVVPRC